MNENRNFNEDFEIEQAGPEDVGCDLFEYELTPEGTYVPKIAYTSDPEEEKLLKKPIRRWGRAWMKWMEAEHPADVDILVCECRWQIIPREIDIEAEERFDELDEIAKLEDPRSRGKALTGNLAGVWRYRVGDYRILCDINDGRLVILVVDVAHRREVYKRR